MRDFTLSAYAELLDCFSEKKLSVFGVSAWLTHKPSVGILMRHDVDRKPENSLAMAELEASRGIATTYYFRILPCSFDRKIVERIHLLGHEIGYHYEDLSIAGGDFSKAYRLFENHLSELRKLAPVRTIAMHGRPLSKIDNRDLWKQRSFVDFGIESEAFLSVDYRGLYYLTDTGRTWHESGVNLRDHVEGAKQANVESTRDLIQFISSEMPQRLSIVCHPERWSNSIADWTIQLGKDKAANTIKRGLRLARGYRS